MAKNSAKAGKKVGDGEGPSSPKRPRKNNGHDEEEDGSCKNGSEALTITDQDIFDCPICFEPLTVPVFQVRLLILPLFLLSNLDLNYYRDSMLV